MDYFVHNKGKSLTYEEIINNVNVNFILDENDDTPPLIILNLYYCLPGPNNSKIMQNKRLFLSKSTYYEILDHGEKILHRSFNHYKERIKLMFDEIFTDSELSYQKIFPELNLGLPFVMSFEITS